MEDHQYPPYPSPLPPPARALAIGPRFRTSRSAPLLFPVVNLDLRPTCGVSRPTDQENCRVFFCDEVAHTPSVFAGDFTAVSALCRGDLVAVLGTEMRLSQKGTFLHAVREHDNQSIISTTPITVSHFCGVYICVSLRSPTCSVHARVFMFFLVCECVLRF